MQSAVINLNKPAGISSQGAVSRVKGALKVKKAGHAGTLDPDASGVLIVCTGRATRLADYLQALPKEYEATMTLGLSTDTQDASGRVIRRTGPSNLREEDIIKILPDFTGNLEQVPPMYSALKSGGTPLYKLARKGLEVDRKARRVEIYSLELLLVDIPVVKFRVLCSRGTYVRTLCHDMGEVLGVGGHMASLVRTAVGDFRLDEAAELDALGPDDLITPGKALYFMNRCRLVDERASRILDGSPVPLEYAAFDSEPKAEESFRIEGKDGTFLGIGRIKNAMIRVERLIFDPRETRAARAG